MDVYFNPPLALLSSFTVQYYISTTDLFQALVYSHLFCAAPIEPGQMVHQGSLSMRSVGCDGLYNFRRAWSLAPTSIARVTATKHSDHRIAAQPSQSARYDMGWLSSLFSSFDSSQRARRRQELSSTHAAFSLPTSSPVFGSHHPDAFNPDALQTPDPDTATTPNYTYPPQGPSAYGHLPSP